MKPLGVLGLALVVFFVGTAESCTSSSQGLQGASPPASSQQRASASPTPAATPAPTPVTLTGRGSKVTDPFTLAAGNYRVSWTAQGHDNFIVDIRAGASSEGLVNEIPPDPATGEAFFRAGGGSYFLEIKASTLTWTITFTPI